MNDEIVKKLIEYVENTKDFVLEQAPNLFKEIFKFDYIIAWLSSIFCLTLILIGIFFSIKFYNETYEKSYDRPFHHIICWISSAILIPMLLVQICSNVSNIIQIKIAPKYYILQKLKGK